MNREVDLRALFSKRRGNRDTSPRALTALGTALYFLVFLLGGVGALLLLLQTLVIPEWEANREFVEARATVLDKRLDVRQDGATVGYRPEIRIRYEVAGQAYETWTYDAAQLYDQHRQEAETVLAGFVRGQEVPCWYDPSQPGRAVLVRGYRWTTWLPLWIPIVFISLGVGGLGYVVFNWNKSHERRAALTQAARAEVFEEAHPGSSSFPYVPDDEPFSNSPGTTLAYRLPSAGPRWSLLGFGLAAVIWNGLVVLASVFALQEALAHPTQVLAWLPVLFVGVMGGAGAWLVVQVARQLLVATGVGPTIVEVAEHPLAPGDEVELFVSQAGRMRLNTLEVRLVCEEEAVFRQGTNTRTAIETVFSQEVLSRQALQLHAEAPLEARGPLRIPDEAMHSFEAVHNRIRWKIVVVGDVAGWPNFQREFTVLVYPTRQGRAA